METIIAVITDFAILSKVILIVLVGGLFLHFKSKINNGSLFLKIQSSSNQDLMVKLADLKKQNLELVADNKRQEKQIDSMQKEIDHWTFRYIESLEKKKDKFEEVVEEIEEEIKNERD